MTIIATIPKGREEVRAVLDQFKGKEMFSLRAYYDLDSGGKPGRNGLNVGVEYLPALADAVTAALAAAREAGTIPATERAAIAA